MEEGQKSTIAQQIARFRAAPPCPKEERASGQAFWWNSSGAKDGDSTLMVNKSAAAGQLPRTASEGANQLQNTPASLRIKKGRFTIQHDPGSPQASSPHRPASSSIAGTAVTVNATAAAMPSLDALQHLIARNPALFKALTELERDEQGKISFDTLERIRSALDTQAGPQSQPQQRSAVYVQQSPSVSADSGSSTCIKSTAAGMCEAPRNSIVSNSAVAASSNKYQGLPAGELTHRLVAHQATAEQAAARAAVAAAALCQGGIAQPVAGSSTAGSTAVASSSATTAVSFGVAACNISDQLHASSAANKDSGTTVVPARADALCLQQLVCSSPGSLTAAVVTCSSPAVGSAGATCSELSSPNQAVSENAASGVSSNLSSRRASLRLSLSIDVSQHKESSSSSSTESGSTSSAEDGSNEPGIQDAADEEPQQQQQQQDPVSGQSTSSSIYPGHPKPWDVDVSTQQGRDSSDDAMDYTPDGLCNSSKGSDDHPTTAMPHHGGNKHHKPATPGFALKTAFGIFSRSAIDSDSDEEKLHQLPAHCSKANQQQQQWHEIEEFEAPPEQLEQQQQHPEQHWHHKLSKRPPTPGVSLGKPVSIFSSGSSSSSCSNSSAAQMPAGSCTGNRAQHDEGVCPQDWQEQSSMTDYGLERELPAAEKMHSTKQHWHHKLLKRPPTPGVSLSKPISIFSSSRDSSPELLQPGNKSSSSPSAAGPDALEARSADEPRDDSTANHAVQFAELGDKASTDRQMQQRKQTKPWQQGQQGREGHKPEVRQHQWNYKLSKRPPTPGAGLGQPASIFSNPGGHASGTAQPTSSCASSSTGSSSSSSRKPSADKFAACSSSEGKECAGGKSAVGAKHSKQRLVAFKQELEEQPRHQQGKLQEDEGVSSRLVHFLEEAESQATGASKNQSQLSQRLAKEMPRTHTEQQQQQRCQHKLSKRPPTPGVGLGDPVSIFKYDRRDNHHSGSSAAKPASGGGGYAGAASAETDEPKPDEPKPGYKHESSSSDADDDDDDDDEAAHVRFKETKPGVVFRQELLHFSDSPIPFQQACAEHQPTVGQQPKSKQSRQQWGSKLSKRPPTPGVGLGQPASIFKQDAAPGRSHDESEAMQQGCDTGTESDGDNEPAAPIAASQHGTVHFASLEARADPTVRFAAATVSPAATGQVSKECGSTQPEEEGLKQGLQQPAKQHWHHKLLKRLPTPGVSLGKPLSIFSSDSSSSQFDASQESTACCAATTMPPAVVAATVNQCKSVAEVLCTHNADLAVDLQETSVPPHEQTGDEHEERTTALSATTTGHHSRAADTPAGVPRGKPWALKLSKRTPTPGLGLHQPVSIFSSGGDSCVAEHFSSCSNTIAESHTEHFLEGVHVQQTAELAMLATASATAKQEAWAKKLAASKPATPAAGVDAQHAVHFRRTESEDDEDATVQCTKHEAKAKNRPRVSFTDEQSGDEQLPASRLQQQQQAAAPKVGVNMKQTPGRTGADEQMQPARCRVSLSDEPVAEAANGLEQLKSQKKLSKHPVAPNAVLLKQSVSILVDNALFDNPDERDERDREADDVAAQPVTAAVAAVGTPGMASTLAAAALTNTAAAASPQREASSSAVRKTDSSNISTAAEPPSRVSLQQALLRQNPDLALEKQAQHERKMSKHPTTPGAGLGKPFSMFKNDASHSAAGTEPAALQEAAVKTASAAYSAAELNGRLSSCGVSSGRSSIKAALLLHNADLALDQQAQQERKMPKHATTPGAGLSKRFSVFEDDSDEVDSDAPGQHLPLSCAAAPPAAAAGSNDSNSAGSRASSGRTSIQSALLLHNSDLALEQQAQQERKMSKHPTTPGAGLGKPFNMFKDPDDDADEGPYTATAHAASASAASLNSNGRISIQSALLLHNSDLALEQQTQQGRKMSKHPTTPGAGLGKPFNMFKDDDADEGQYKAPAEPAAAATVDTAAPCALAMSSSSSSTGRTSIQSALLLHNSDLALEQQAQKERKMSKHPTTPGAGLGKHFSIFKNDSDDKEGDNEDPGEDTEQLGVPAVLAKLPARLSQRLQDQQQLRRYAPSSATMQEAIVSHNPDLELEKQAQQERKMKKHPTTPGAGLGKPFNMFRDDSDESDGEGCGSCSSISSPGRPIPTVSPKLPSDSNRSSYSSSTRRLGSANNSSGLLRSTSPDMMTLKHGLASNNSSAAAVRQQDARSGRMNSERPCRASTSPLRHSSNVADSDPSPLRRSSSAADPDPARLSPLGHRPHSNTGTAQDEWPSAGPMSAGSNVEVCDLASSISGTQQDMQSMALPSSGSGRSELHTTSASEPAKLWSSPLHCNSSAEAAVIAVAAAIAPVAVSPHSPHSPSRLSRSTSPANGREASRSSSPSPLRRSSNSSMPPAATVVLTDVSAYAAGHVQAAHELSKSTCITAGGSVGQLASANRSATSDKLSVRPPEILAPPCTASSPAAMSAGSGTISSSPLSRTSIGATTGALSGSNGSFSPLRHASSMNDPLPARGSPLRRDSSCTGTPVSGRSSRHNNIGWEEHVV